LSSDIDPELLDDATTPAKRTLLEWLLAVYPPFCKTSF
jgi:hypothetical protein